MSHPVNIRLNDELKIGLQQLADSQHRTLSNLIKFILTEYLNKEFENDKSSPESRGSAGVS